jgi:tetraacyldisaccharide 4'-kinase
VASLRERAAQAAWALWDGDGAGARVARAALAPAAALYGAAVRRRNARFDAARPPDAELPALSVGNLTVGGTGKTPVAAWCVAQLRAAGAHPAVVLRGYGDDEWRVHEHLAPGMPVVAAADRTAGVRRARGLGADCAVLDDAFQHRRVARLADLVLLSADRWTGRVRLLPAGPWREPLGSLARADVAVVTRKAAADTAVDAVIGAMSRAVPRLAVAVVALRLAEVVTVAGAEPRADGGSAPPRRALRWLAGRRVVVASGIGDPAAFLAQVAAAGAQVAAHRAWPDHHAFGAAEAAQLARLGAGADGVLVTLKDAVKLGPRWPREGPPLWYVSQTVVVERGADVLQQALSRVLAARAAAATGPG